MAANFETQYFYNYVYDIYGLKFTGCSSVYSLTIIFVAFKPVEGESQMTKYRPLLATA
jgi:hypothetical protein